MCGKHFEHSIFNKDFCKILVKSGKIRGNKILTTCYGNSQYSVTIYCILPKDIGDDIYLCILSHVTKLRPRLR